MTAPADLPAPETPAEAAEQDWYFTFGAGQYLFAGHRRGADIQVSVVIGGIPLSRYYVVIHGTFVTAQNRMHELFGDMWCDQYESLEQFAPYYPKPPIPFPIDLQGGEQ